jgi:hypothetical protein
MSASRARWARRFFKIVLILEAHTRRGNPKKTRQKPLKSIFRPRRALIRNGKTRSTRLFSGYTRGLREPRAILFRQTNESIAE